MVERNEYKMIGRYNNGNEITAYALMNKADGTTKKYSKEQVVYLAGRGQIADVDGQIYKDDVLLRGLNGFSINKLPVKKDLIAKAADEEASTESGEPNPNTYFEVPPILSLTAVARQGRSVIAYLVYNSSQNRSKALSREKVIKLAADKKIANAWTQLNKADGTRILRGLNCNLGQLRSMTPEEMEEYGIKVKRKAKPAQQVEPMQEGLTEAVQEAAATAPVEVTVNYDNKVDAIKGMAWQTAKDAIDLLINEGLQVDERDMKILEDQVKSTALAFAEMRRAVDSNHKLNDYMKCTANSGAGGVDGLDLRFDFTTRNGQKGEGGYLELTYLASAPYEQSYNCFEVDISAWLKEDFNDMDDATFEWHSENSTGPTALAHMFANPSVLDYLRGGDTGKNKEVAKIRDEYNSHLRKNMTIFKKKHHKLMAQ